MAWIQAYDDPQLVRAFEKTHPVPGNVAHSIGRTLLEIVRDKVIRRGSCTIFFPGCGKGHANIIPLVEDVFAYGLGEGRPAPTRVIAVDSSPQMLKGLITGLRTCAARPRLRDADETIIAQRDDISVIVFQADLESREFRQKLERLVAPGDIDVVLDHLLVHHLTDWRATYGYILSLLHENASFVLDEIRSEYIAAIDALPGRTDPLLDAIRTFHRERWKQRGIIWDPELCGSDLKAFTAWLSTMMRQVNEHDFSWPQPYSAATVRQALRDGLHSPIYWGHDDTDALLAAEVMRGVNTQEVVSSEAFRMSEYMFKAGNGTTPPPRDSALVRQKAMRYGPAEGDESSRARALHRRVMLQLLVSHGFLGADTLAVGVERRASEAIEVSLLINRSHREVASAKGSWSTRFVVHNGPPDTEPKPVCSFGRFDLYEELIAPSTPLVGSMTRVGHAREWKELARDKEQELIVLGQDLKAEDSKALRTAFQL